MAKALWGHVYYLDRIAGILQQEPDGTYVFTYDPSYLDSDNPAISHSLPVRAAPFHSKAGLHPFFDNLVAEGWLRNAQARALGVKPDDRFALLLAFGRDCAGAVSIIDPEPYARLELDAADPERVAALTARASLSGIQPKLTAIKEAGKFRPARPNETSTYIAKLSSGQLPEIIALEWLATEATRGLLPDETIVEMEIAPVGDIAQEALLIRRFDRLQNGQRLHFEEFNQLLGNPSRNKYEGSYEDMAGFIRHTPGCIPAEAERLYRRILACFLVGNTDAHLKNFAMFHTDTGMRLTPCYDLVGSAVYPQFDTITLALTGAENHRLGNLQPKHIVGLGRNYGLSDRAIKLAVEDLGKTLDAARTRIAEARVGTLALRDGLTAIMEKRWNGTFALTGQLLSKKRAAGGRRKTLRSRG